MPVEPSKYYPINPSELLLIKLLMIYPELSDERRPAFELWPNDLASFLFPFWSESKNPGHVCDIAYLNDLMTRFRWDGYLIQLYYQDYFPDKKELPLEVAKGEYTFHLNKYNNGPLGSYDSIIAASPNVHKLVRPASTAKP